MKAAAVVTIPISTVWNWFRDLVIRRELSREVPGVEFDVQAEVKEGESELKKILLILVATVTLSGCASFQKHTIIAETLVRCAARDMGYRAEQIKAMADTQAPTDPLMAANLRDLAGLLAPDAGVFRSGLDQAAQEGFEDGVKLFLGR